MESYLIELGVSVIFTSIAIVSSWGWSAISIYELKREIQELRNKIEEEIR